MSVRPTGKNLDFFKSKVFLNLVDRINMKGFVHHTPTDDDIANIMTEFTVDFLLKGYRFLVNDLYAKLSTNKEMVKRLRKFI